MTDIKKLARKIVDNLVDCGLLDEGIEEQYIEFTEAQLSKINDELKAANQRVAELENDEVRQRLANAEYQLEMAEIAKHNLRSGRKAQFHKRKLAERRIAELESSIANERREWMARGADAVVDALSRSGAFTFGDCLVVVATHAAKIRAGEVG